MTRCFEGYLAGPVEVDARAYERRFRAEHLDPFASRLYLRDGRPVGILLVARRGWTGRIAAMGVAPEARRRGLGRRAMAEAIGDAGSRGDRAMVLEVFEQNGPARSLYAGLGFRARRRLVGYGKGRSTAAPGTDDVISELDPLELARVVAREGEPDLPWLLSAEALSAATSPARAYHLHRRAYALVDDAGGETLVLRALVVPRANRRRGWGSRLLCALGATFPERAWYVPEIVPEDLAHPFFLGLGWDPSPLAQLEMRLELPH